MQPYQPSMKKICFVPLFFIFSQVQAQSAHTSYWSIGINPLGIVETIPSIGMNMSYRISPRFEIWGETSLLVGNPYKIQGWKNLKGYRLIFQPRYYTGGEKRFFIAPEFRLKQYSYSSTGTFMNISGADTLYDYSYKGSQVLIGGAFVMGGQFILSKQHHLYLEVTAGIGSKQRFITRKNDLINYKYQEARNCFALAPHYDWDDTGAVYFPLGFRLTWKLNQRKQKL